MIKVELCAATGVCPHGSALLIIFNSQKERLTTIGKAVGGWGGIKHGYPMGIRRLYVLVPHPSHF